MVLYIFIHILWKNPSGSLLVCRRRNVSMNIEERLRAEAERIEDAVRDVRRRIHAHPEPGYEERETAALVTERLQAQGIPHRTGLAKTGVVARIDGSGPGRCVALRADMDALRKEEAVPESIRPHRSKRPGLMHACGHDGHVAVLLGACEILWSLRGSFAGTVIAVFQPAEEGGRGGDEMVKAGVLDDPKVEAAFALHAWPDLPCGVLGFQYGTSMAASSDFTIEILGRSGHAAFPHQCIDPVPASAAVVTALQTIRSREIGPLEGSAVSVTVIETGTKIEPDAPPGRSALRPSQTNIIPPVVRLRGTSRSLSVAGQELQLKRIEGIAKATASAFRCEVGFAVEKSYPPTVHDRAMTDFAMEAAGGLFPADRVVLLDEPCMGGEDFSFFLQKVPGTFVHLGTGRWTTEAEHALEPPLHADAFDFNDEALVPGMVFLGGLAIRFLSKA